LNNLVEHHETLSEQALATAQWGNPQDVARYPINLAHFGSAVPPITRKLRSALKMIAMR
jgi:hypothetical protein